MAEHAHGTECAMSCARRHKAKRHAEEQAEQMFNARYRPEQYQPPPQGWGYNLGVLPVPVSPINDVFAPLTALPALMIICCVV